MEKNNFISKEFKEELADYIGDLGRAIHTYKLFRYCMENNAYMYNRCEIYCFAVILEKYFNHVKSKFDQMQEELGAF